MKKRRLGEGLPWKHEQIVRDHHKEHEEGQFERLSKQAQDHIERDSRETGTWECRCHACQFQRRINDELTKGHIGEQ